MLSIVVITHLGIADIITLAVLPTIVDLDKPLIQLQELEV